MFPLACASRAWCSTISGHSGEERLRVRSAFSAISRASTVKAFETCVSCASAPVQGPATAGHVEHTANSSEINAILTPSFLGYRQDLVCFYIVQHLHRPTRPLQFDFLNDRI